MYKRKWPADTVDYFVNLYKGHECLWNVKKNTYSDKSSKDAAFADIAEKMKTNKGFDKLEYHEMKEKILSLRSMFYRYRKQHKYDINPADRVGNWYNDMEHIVKHSRVNVNKKAKNSNLSFKLDDALMMIHAYSNDGSISDETEDAASSSIVIKKESSNVALLQEEMYLAAKETLVDSSVKLQSRIEIMNVLKKLYKEKVTPTLSIMFDILTKIIQNDDKCLTSSIGAFKLEMTKLGYLYKETIDGNQIIVENAEQRFERFLYLTKIRNIRSRLNKTIVYIDERVINIHLNYPKLHDLKIGLPAESSIFFHAITKNGLCNGLFSNQASEEDFNKWVTDILLVCLRSPCVIVMDNGPLHGKLEDTCPITRYSTKMEMLKWLHNCNIPCSANLARPELFELIRKNKIETKEYKIDRIIRSHGHEVLRLPTSFPDLNMTEILWNAIVEGNSANLISKTNTYISQQVLQNTILEGLIPSIGAKKWNDLEKVLVMKENDIYEIDATMESILDTYIFM